MLQVKNGFTGSFLPGCQKAAVPASLKILIDMILKGVTINEETAAETANKVPNQVSFTISQLLMFNSISRVRDGKDPSCKRKRVSFSHLCSSKNPCIDKRQISH